MSSFSWGICRSCAKRECCDLPECVQEMKRRDSRCRCYQHDGEGVPDDVWTIETDEYGRKFAEVWLVMSVRNDIAYCVGVGSGKTFDFHVSEWGKTVFTKQEARAIEKEYWEKRDKERKQAERRIEK